MVLLYASWKLRLGGALRQPIAGYLDERSTDTPPTGFAPWGSDGAYQRIGPTLIASDNNYTLAEANQTYDTVYQNGGLYHLMSHPADDPWGSAPIAGTGGAAGSSGGSGGETEEPPF